MPTTVLASELLDISRSTYLNDPNAGTYTNAVLLPYLKTAYGLMETALEENGVQCKNEEDTITVLTGADEYLPLPVNLVIPMRVLERQAGSTDEFRPITYRNNIPQITSTPFLEYWTWRGDRLLFLAATTDREAKLEYLKAFPAVNSQNDALFGKAEHYLSAKVAALALLFIAQSTTLAEQANNVAEAELEQIINLQVKGMQKNPIRQKPFVPFRTR